MYVLTIYSNHPRNEIGAEFGGVLVFVVVVKLTKQNGRGHTHIILFLLVAGRQIISEIK